MAAILIVLKAFWVKALEFIVTNWKPILVGVFLVGLVYFGYQHGSTVSDEKWIKKHNAEVKALNDKIKGLEDQSKASGLQNGKDKDALEKRITELLGNKPKIAPQTPQGKPLTCNGTPETEIYLGSVFSQRWNALTLEGNK